MMLEAWLKCVPWAVTTKQNWEMFSLGKASRNQQVCAENPPDGNLPESGLRIKAIV